MKYLNNNALILYLFFQVDKKYNKSTNYAHIISRGHILEYETSQNETLCEVHIIFFIGIDLLFIQISCAKQKL